MTEEEKYINSLFNAAKNEPPKRSFEEVTKRFEKTIIIAPTTTSWSKTFPKLINLNTLLMTLIGSLILAGFIWTNTSVVEQSPVLAEVNETINITPRENKKELLPIDNQLIAVKKPSLLNKDVSLKKSQKPSIIPKHIAINKHSSTKTSPLAKILSKTSNQKTDVVANPSAPSIISEQEISPPAPTPISEIITPESTILTNESTNVLDSSSTATEKTKAIKEPFVLFELQHTANKKTTTTFLQMIGSYGFSVAEKVNRAHGNIQKLQVNISLYNGLDWKIKLRNFEALEIKIFLDEHKNPMSIAYRLNQAGQFCKPISLNSKARSYHKFAKGKGTGNHTFTRSTRQRN